tara:strand:- start:6751 stop:7047 length:297 start_codon:yes stop_codon:yes gene_type:complete
MIPFIRVTSVNKEGTDHPKSILLRADLIVFVEPIGEMYTNLNPVHPGKTVIVFNNCDKPYETIAIEDFYTVQAKIEDSIYHAYQFRANIQNNVSQVVS